MANHKEMVFKNLAKKVQVMLEALYQELSRAMVVIIGIAAVANIMENSVEVLCMIKMVE